jgi:RimJ/RimL family protein N-acetyltransferase
MREPFLVGERVYLRRLTDEDLGGEYLSALNNYELTQWFDKTGRFPATPIEMRKYLEQASQDASQILLAVCLKVDDRHVGNVQARIDWVNRSAMTGRIIWATDLSGTGIGVESFSLFLSYLFERLNLNRVWSGCIDGNIAALKNWEKLGYKIEGRLRQAVWQDGAFRDVIQGGILREEWRARVSRSLD